MRGRLAKHPPVAGVLALAGAPDWEPTLRIALLVSLGHFAVNAEQSAVDPHVDVCDPALAFVDAASAAPTRMDKVSGAAVADFVAALFPTRKGAVCGGAFSYFVSGDFGLQLFLAHWFLLHVPRPADRLRRNARCTNFTLRQGRVKGQTKNPDRFI